MMYSFIPLNELPDHLSVCEKCTPKCPPDHSTHLHGDFSKRSFVTTCQFPKSTRMQLFFALSLSLSLACLELSAAFANGHDFLNELCSPCGMWNGTILD